MDDELLKVDEVAKILKVTRKSVYDLMRAERLPYVVVGVTRGRRIRRSALEAFLSGASRGLYNDRNSSYTDDHTKSPGLVAA